MRFLILLLLLVAPGLAGAQELLGGQEYNKAIGDSLFKEGRFQEAREYYRIALYSSKRNPELSYQMARVHIKLNEIPQAKRQLRRASRIGFYKADLLLDSLEGRNSENVENELFEKELEEYLRKTDPKKEK